MKEIHEFRIFEKHYHLLSKTNNAHFNGAVYVLRILKDDPLFQEVGHFEKDLKKIGMHFFSFWDVQREYTKKELDNASLFHFNIKSTFEPTGEECGTVYDETKVCKECGVNRTQISILKLKRGSIPKKDIARTIAGEVVVSERFVKIFTQRKLAGAIFNPIVFEKTNSDYHQLIVSAPELKLTGNTITGHNPFDLSLETIEATNIVVSGGYKVRFEKEIYKCSYGHLIGPRLLSEPYIYSTSIINEFDLFISEQKIGVKQGLLRPEPLYLCSQAFRKMVEEEKLSGFNFEIANIE